MALCLASPELPCPLNLWMNTPFREWGAMGWLLPVSVPGDLVRLGAEMDCVAVLSCCPMDLLPINGIDIKPTSLAVRMAG